MRKYDLRLTRLCSYSRVQLENDSQWNIFEKIFSATLIEIFFIIVILDMFHLPALSAVLVVTSVWETRWRWPALCLSPGQSWWDSPGTDPTPPPSLPASSSPTLSPGTCQWEELTSRQWSRSWSCAMLTRRTRAATLVWWWTTQTTTRWGFNWPNLKSTLKSCLHPSGSANKIF